MTVSAPNCQNWSNVSMAEMELPLTTNNAEWQLTRARAESYIRMVQHLIERCLVVRMDCDDCVNALSNPVLTRTVWKELVRENQDFFRAYYRNALQN